MAVYDLEEQERLDALKDWWAQYGKMVYAFVTAVAVSFAAYHGWHYYQKTQNEQAETLFQSLQKVAAANDAKKLSGAAQLLIDKFPGSFYATDAALQAAKAAFAAKDYAGARTHLQWAADKGKAGFRSIAQLRLAAVLLEEKKYDEALKVVESVNEEGYISLSADLKGDILLSQGKKDAARTAYQLALDKSDTRSPIKQITQFKLDALGVQK
jgi:predicted negative regulator of RcsB-dependent stress response